MKEILVDLYLFGGVAALGGMLLLLGYGVRWAAAKVPWTVAQKVIVAAWDLIATVTREANAEFQAQITIAKSAESPGGKKITKKEWAEARQAALEKFKRLYGVGSLKELASALNLSLGEQLDEWIGATITGGMKLPSENP